MRSIDLLHRWTGGLVGLLLCILGLSGTLLLHRDWFVRMTVDHTRDAPDSDVRHLAAIADRLLAHAGEQRRGLLLASDQIGVHRLFFTDPGRGAYVATSGQTVERWSREWQRPEVWLFDLHHHLFAGESGTTIVGLLGIIGFGFVMTGILLWWRTRSTFELRLLPRRMTRGAIVRHHRDVGICAAPMLLLSFLSGALMCLKPLEAAILAPLGPSVQRPQPSVSGPAGPIDWVRILTAARTRYPAAELRWLGLPSARDGRVLVRMRQPDEPTPNGRTMLWFETSGKLDAVEDGRGLPLRDRVANLEYPLHAGVYPSVLLRWLLTASGLALTALGSLTVWTFWFRRPNSLPRR